MTNIIDGMDEARFQSPNRNGYKPQEKKVKRREKNANGIKKSKKWFVN